MRVDMNKFKLLFTKVTRQKEAVDYEAFIVRQPKPKLGELQYNMGELQLGTGDSPEFTFDNTRLFIMKEHRDRRTLLGYSPAEVTVFEKLKNSDGSLVFGSMPQFYQGMGYKVHYFEHKQEILLCYIFTNDYHCRRKVDRSPNSAYGSYKSGSGSLIDMQDRSLDEDMASSATSASSVASSFFSSVASSLGFGSLNGNFSTSIPTEHCLTERPVNLKRAASSPSQLAAEGITNSGQQKREKLKIGISFVFNCNHSGALNFRQLKQFVLQNFYFIETQAMVVRQMLRNRPQPVDDEAARGFHERFLRQLRILTKSERVFNLWHAANLHGLSGPQSSCRAKASVVDLIVDLYDRFEGERSRRFLSTVVTGILSAWSSWHVNICHPDQVVESLEGRRVLDLYGGDSTNFPVRVCFVSSEREVLIGFLALSTYLQRSLIFVRNHRSGKTKFHPISGASLNLAELPFCGYPERTNSAIASALESGTFSLLVDENSYLRPAQSSETLCSTLTSSTETLSEHSCPRYCSMFVDYQRLRGVVKEVVPACLPVLSDTYHPALPVMGLPSTEGVFSDQKEGFAPFHDALQMSIKDGVAQKMIINNATTLDSKILVSDDRCQVIPAGSIVKILRNFVRLKQLTGNSKHCLYYLETELQSLAYIREAYLTFCSRESAPPDIFLSIFKLEKSDGEFFNLIKK